MSVNLLVRHTSFKMTVYFPNWCWLL